VLVVAGVMALMMLPIPAHAAGPRTNRTNVPYSDGVTRSKGHIFAKGLDWAKPVGLLVYMDGSGERGLRSYNDSYLLDADGNTGLVEAARRRNLLLVTPFAPGGGCDGAGSTETCWSWPSGSMSVQAKTKWAFDFTQWIRTQYTLTGPTVIGGYSSGARATTEFLGPEYGKRMSVDLMVAISLGGPPKFGPDYTHRFRVHTPVVWNVGSKDSFLTQPRYGVRRGYNWYRAAGFTTELTIVPGLGHSRSDFDKVIGRAVDRYLPML
jgi:hypothetical protein